MRLIDPILMEFDREASATRKVLERVPDAKLGWAPHPRSMTAGKLAWHLATIPGWIGTAVLLDGEDMATRPKAPPAPATAREIAEAFTANVEVAKRAMVQLDDEAAAATWTLSMAGKVILSMPRLAFLRTILLSHSIHHRGQLTVYLRFLEVPVPAIYGPSADENPLG